MKRFVALFLVAVLALSTVSVMAAEAPVRGGTLNAAVAAKWTSLDPTTSSARAGDKFILNQLYETLIVEDANGYQPGLAESWVAEDKSLTLTLRQGVKFHDGTDFNAEAVKFVLDRGMTAEAKATYKSEVADVENVEVVDEYTVRINLKNPSAVIVGALSNYAGFMISPAAIEKFGEDIVRNPVGTGPFMMEEAVDGDHITLVRNPEYWKQAADGQPLPYLDKVVITVMSDDASKLLNLKSGAISLIDNIQNINIATLDTAEITALKTSATKTYKMMVNVNDEGPLSDPKVRQAMAYALYRDAFVQAISAGYGYIGPWNITPDQWFYSEGTPYTYDVEKAKALLAEAGYPDGFETTFHVTAREPDKTIIQIIQGQLAEVGIKGEIVPLEKLAFNDLWKNGEGKIGLNFCPVPKPDPYIQIEQFFGSAGNNNFTGYASEEFDSLLEQSVRTYDLEERKALIAQMQQVFLTDSPEVMLFHNPTYMAYRNDLHGFYTDLEGGWILSEAYIK